MNKPPSPCAPARRNGSAAHEPLRHDLPQIRLLDRCQPRRRIAVRAALALKEPPDGRLFCAQHSTHPHPSSPGLSGGPHPTRQQVSAGPPDALRAPWDDAELGFTKQNLFLPEARSAVRDQLEAHRLGMRSVGPGPSSEGNRDNQQKNAAPNGAAFLVRVASVRLIRRRRPGRGGPQRW